MKLITEAKVTLSKPEIQEAVDDYCLKHGVKRTSAIDFQFKASLLPDLKKFNEADMKTVAKVSANDFTMVMKGCSFTAVVAEKKGFSISVAQDNTKVNKVAEIKKSKLDDKTAGKGGDKK